MRTELPQRWCIKACNNEEAQIIQPYANEMATNDGNSPWSIGDCKHYYLSVEDGKYYGGNGGGYSGFEKLTIEEFQTLVLGNTLEPNYEIY